jgi:hypothetical protein
MERTDAESSIIIEYRSRDLLNYFVIACNENHEKVIVQLGSNWNNGSNAGTFYWNVNNSVSNRNQNISGHLMNARCSRDFSRLF